METRWTHGSENWLSFRTGIRTLTCLALILGSTLGLGSPLPRHDDRSNDQPASAEIPFELYNDNLIIVKAVVGPLKNANFILDTGTNPSAITQNTAERLRLIETKASVQTLQGTIQTETIVVPDIQVGPLHAASIRMIVQDLAFVERSLGIPLAGLIGLDILSTSSFTIDYRKKNIKFGPVAATFNAVRFETTTPLLIIKAKLEGEELRLVADSGIAGLLLYRNRLPTVHMQVTRDPIASISTVGGTTRLQTLRTTVSLGENDLGVHDLVVADVDSDPKGLFDGLLGFRRMGFHKVSFDFEKGLFGWE